jgi:uncharacterized protein YjiS (DUF1127 family)
MSTIRQTTEPVAARRPVYSPLDAYWNAFQAWRRRRSLQAELSNLSDAELEDVGITRGEIDDLASPRSGDPASGEHTQYFFISAAEITQTTAAITPKPPSTRNAV